MVGRRERSVKMGILPTCGDAGNRTHTLEGPGVAYSTGIDGPGCGNCAGENSDWDLQAIEFVILNSLVCSCKKGQQVFTPGTQPPVP